MFGHMVYFTSSSKPREERKIHRSTPEDFVRFKPNGQPARWPGRGTK